MTFLALFASLLFLLFLGVPIAVGLGGAAIAGMLISDMPIFMFTQRLYNTFDSFPLMAVPFFILAGEVMQQGTIANKLLGFCRTLVGHMRGGLSHISILTCLFYGALSGSAPATTAAVGGIMIPAMVEEGYPRAYATAVNCAGGCLGVMIPPSVPLILYGATVGCSISDLFIATIIPGIICGIALILLGYYFAARNNYGQCQARVPYAERLKKLWEAKFAVLMPVIVLGGIYGGIVTPTEAGCVAVVYAFFVETFLTRSMTWKKVRGIFISSMRTTGAIFVIIACANAFGIVLVYYNAQEYLSGLIFGISSNKYIVLLIIIFILFCLGTFLDTAVIILVLAPMLVPVLNTLGINLTHFGVAMVVTLTVGFLTPPVGVNLFVGAGIGDVSFSLLSRAVLPFVLLLTVCSVLIAFIPILSLCLL